MRVRRTDENAVQGDRATSMSATKIARDRGGKAAVLDAAQWRADALVVGAVCRRGVHRINSFLPLFHLLADEVERLECGFVRHHEEIGVAAFRLVARPGPVRHW